MNDAEAAFRRNEDLFYTTADDELIIMDDAQESFLTSNVVGSFIWEQLDRPMTVTALGDMVTAQFAGVDAEQARADVRQFLAELQRRGLAQEVASA